ncbi:MAG TPA: LCCL domain-containing protein [Casimicrobiaceae bacterium]|nr:LCCL domain-containing protein [Casimicrobiaceae bacterium]
MKVVQELVAYFDRRGKLSPAQLRALLDHGYLAADAPPNLLELSAQVRDTFYFRVMGASEGPLWGTDVYTGDSAIAVAAVHAGLVSAGGSAVLRVVAVAPPPQFSGSVRNGVTSHDFGRYGSAYQLSAV